MLPEMSGTRAAGHGESNEGLFGGPRRPEGSLTQNTLYPIFKSCPYSIGGYLLFDI